MKAVESFKIGITGLRSNKLRAALTMLGIVFGVAAVIAMMSIGEGAKQETLQQIELMGTNNIIIQRVAIKQGVNKSKAMFSPGLNLEDAKAIKELVPLIEYVTPQREMNQKLVYKSTLLDVKLIGTTPEYPQTFNSKIEAGTFFQNFHISSYANVCVIGSGIKEKLFKFEDPLYKKIKLGDLWFDVIGVMARKNISPASSGSLGLRDFNDDIYVPISTMMYKMEQPPTDQSNIMFYYPGMQEPANVIDRNSVDQLTAKVKNSEELKAAAYLVEKIMERRHYGIKDYSIVLPEELLAQKQKTQRIFNIVMGAIAGISLLVGGIGIMNIMLANILERTREIGVRRAVGATKIDVLSQFIYEALTISIVGGLLGIVVGFFLTSLISTYAEWKTIISPLSVVLAFVVSVATGLIFGIYPAKQAAEKNPIDSLRYE
ncbi:MAG: ABC transporter permease [Bacteroidetes bacterium]|nr:ABC transporter permease [Bacteroidota bacterium]